MRGRSSIMTQKKQISFFLLLYAALRIFSYFFSPETPLYAANQINTIISALILLTTIYLLWKKDERGWYIIALEILLGGAGGYLAVGKLSLRTSLLICSIVIYFLLAIKDKRIKMILSQTNSYPIILLSSLICWGMFSALRGYFAGHAVSLTISDTIPYLFFLYYFPLRELAQSEKFKQIASNALIATIIGNFLLIIVTFINFSSGHFVLQDTYYHWYRDVALGKITELPFHFYRLVLNEHLLLIPALLWLLSIVISNPLRRGEKSLAHQTMDRDSSSLAPASSLGMTIKLTSALAMTLLAILSINLTRIYLVALVVGLLCLFNRANWKRWLTISIFSFLFFIFSFTAIHFAASRGQSLGWEIFGLRLQSIASPQIEDSSLSRLLLLPKILEKIKAHPLLGEGLGATVTVYSPVFKQEITTPHFDWGYLEIIAEMGIIGLAIWLLVIGYWLLITIKNSHSTFQISSLTAILVINITSPALFHVLGIIWLTYLLASALNLSKSSLKSV